MVDELPQPGAVPGRHGSRARRARRRERQPPDLDGVELPRVPRARPAGRAAMQTGVGESTLAGDGGLKWVGTYHAMLASPLTPVDVVGGHLLDVDRPPRCRAAWLFLAGDGAVRRRRVAVAAVLAVPAAVLTGLAFAAPMTALRGVARERAARSRPSSGSCVIPMFLFSGTFFPVEQLPAVLALDRLRHPAVARRRRCAGAWPSAPSARWRPLGHVAVLCAFAGVGLALAFALLPAEAHALMAARSASTSAWCPCRAAGAVRRAPRACASSSATPGLPARSG